MNTIKLRLLWYPQAQFAGYLLAEHAGLGRARAIEIQCLPIDFALGPVEAVLTGAVDFAVASPSHILECRAPEALTMLLAIQQTSSLVYPARRATGIATIADLTGHRVGVWPGGEDLELRWMLHRAGVAEDRIARIPVKDSAAAMHERSVDCAQMTTYHEWPHLVAEDGPAEDFVLFSAAGFGASLLKDGLIARRDWIAANPEVAQAVVDAVLEGWTTAFRDPATAIRVCCTVRPDMQEAEHAAQLAEIRRLSLTGATLVQGLGYPDPAHLHAAAAAIRETEGRSVAFPAERLVDDRLWRAAPSSFRSATW